MTDRQGILPVTVVDPLTGKVYPASTQIPIAQLNPFAAYALSNLPPVNAGTATSRVQQRRSAAADPRLQRQVRRQDRRSDQRQHDGVPALQPAQGPAVFRSRISPGPRAATATATSTSIDQNASVGYTWTVDADLAPRSALRIHPRSRRQRAAVPGRAEPGSRCSAFRACPPRRISPAVSTRRPSAASHRAWAARPAIRSSRIRPRSIRS